MAATREEVLDLTKYLEQLNADMLAPGFASLDAAERGLMREQAEHMRGYARCLAKRRMKTLTQRLKNIHALN